MVGASSRRQLLAKGGTPLIIVLLLLSLASASAVTYPLRWRWSNPRPHGGNVVDMAWSAQAGLAVQVAERGQIFTSSDLNFWIPRDSGVTNDLRAVTFLGGRILVTGVNGRVLYADQPDNWKIATLNIGGTADWLEAAAASGVLAVAVGDNGVVFTTATGTNWTKQVNLSEWLRGVAWGNTTGSGSGVFVAVGENGKAFVSASGSAWTTRSTGTNEHLNRVVFSTLPTPRFIAVGESGVCRFSLDNGTNWLGENTTATNDLQHALTATHLGGGGARAVVGDSEVRLTEFSGGWSNQLASPFGPAAWSYYTGAGRVNSLFIAGQSGMMNEGVKTNGSLYLWAEKSPSVRNLLWDATYVTNLYVAVGDRATVMTSLDGVDWKAELVPDVLTNSIFLGVGGNNDMLVAVGESGGLMVSPNTVTNTTIAFTNGTNVTIFETNASAFGVLWHPFPQPISNHLHGLAATTNFFVTTGGGGKILHSRDATNWTAVTPSLTTRYLSGVTAWPQGWIATGDDGVILSSANGINWSVVHAPNVFTTSWLYRVRYLGGRLIAVGQNGIIATSTSGSSWTKFTSTGTTNWLNDVAFVDGTWFAFGFNGTVLASTNATNWTNLGCITRKDFFAAATDTRQLIAVGEEGAIVRAPIVPDTNAVQILAFDRFALTNGQGVVFMENLYLFGGRTDQQFTVDSTTAIATNQWEAGPKLEFFDSSGTLFYLEMVPLTNAPPHEFYRTPLALPPPAQ